MSQGKVFVITAPSGAGKTSLIKALIETTDNIAVAISHTTRDKRPDELDGVNYHFVSPEAFVNLIAENAFVEWAKVFGNYYGTSRQAIDSITRTGKHLVLEIDWQGAQQIRAKLSEVTTIFILPPSIRVLKDRLRQRAQDDSTSIEKRVQEAIHEIIHYDEFDYLIVNNDFTTALNQIKHIFFADASELTVARQTHQLQQLLANLLINVP